MAAIIGRRFFHRSNISMSGNGKNTLSPARRLGLSGDLPTKLVRAAMPVTPWFLEPFLVAFWTTVIFLLAGTQRRAVGGNLRAMFPHRGFFRSWVGAWRVFHQFALTWVDAQRQATGTGSMDWEVEGAANFRSLENESRGCMLLTAHMGNYDLAAGFFAKRFSRTIHTVRAPERGAEAQKLREAEIARNNAENPGLQTHFNRSGNLLGVELARLIHAGEIVAVQGDRVVFDVSPMEVGIEPGLAMRLPKGPWALAKITRCPVFPLFITRSGWRRYRITIFPEFGISGERGENMESTGHWARIIFQFAKENWDQWFVFEPMFTRSATHR